MSESSLQSSPFKAPRPVISFLGHIHWSSPLVLAGLMLFLCCFLVVAVEYREYQNHAIELSQNLKSLQARARLRLSSDVQFLGLLAEELSDGELSKSRFQDLASRYVLDHPSLINATWADDQFFIRWIAPFEANKQLIGLPLNLDEPRRVSRIAHNLKKPVFSRPFEVLQGEIAFEVCLPVFQKDRFLGSLILGYSINRFYDELNRGQAEQNYHLELVDDMGNQLVQSSVETDFESYHDVTMPVPLANGLQLLLKSGKQVFGLTERILFLLVGLMIALLGLGMMFLLRELDRRKLAESKLKQSEDEQRLVAEQFAVLLNGIPDAVLMYDTDMSIIWANQGVEELFGVCHEDVKGRFCYEALQGRPEPCDSCIVLRCFESGQVAEGKYHAPDGRILSVRAFPVFDHKKKLQRVIELAYDASTEIRHQEELLRSGQLASIGELASGIAHEINNPISGIIGYAEIMQLEANRLGQENDLANRILKEAARVASIVSGLLSFSRQRQDELGPVSLRSVLDEVLLLVETQMRMEGIVFEIDFPDDLPSILGCSHQLQQVFLNLLNNSRYALNQKYPLAVPDKKVTIKGRLKNNSLQVCFYDSGIGIPKPLLNKVMDPFFTTKPEGRGSGLGLSVSKKIMEAHHGSLTVHSIENVFSEFVLQFPAS